MYVCSCNVWRSIKATAVVVKELEIVFDFLSKIVLGSNFDEESTLVCLPRSTGFFTTSSANWRKPWCCWKVLRCFCEDFVHFREFVDESGLMMSRILVNTPYGGRLVVKLPAGTLLFVHLKDKKLIRHKKRWSQVLIYWQSTQLYMNISRSMRWGYYDFEILCVALL